MKQTEKEKLLFWVPRIIVIIYALFLGIFALDVFVPDKTYSYYLTALLMHLIPNFILIILLLISWRYERLGALLFLGAFIVLFVAFWDRTFIWSQLLLFSPLLLTSWLFYLGSWYKEGHKK